MNTTRNRSQSRLRLECLESRETPAISAVGPEFRLNTFIAGTQTAPAIALDADGDFVAAWQSAGEDGSGNAIVARRFARDGSALGASFVVNSFTTGDQTQPAVAINAAGDFVVTWSSTGQDGNDFGVFGRRFDAAGNALGAEFRVNQFTTGNQSLSAVASDAAGNFVVAWTSTDQLGQLGEVYARRFGAHGSALSGEFRVNTFTTNTQSNPAVGMGALGDFAIAWVSNLQDGSSLGVFGQAYGRDGSAVGGEFRVNTFTTGGQTEPGVAVNAAGQFLIAWSSFSQVSPTSSNDMFGQRYAANGSPIGGEFQVNTGTTGSQSGVSIAADASGDFAIGFTTAQTGNNDVAIRPGTAGGALGTQLNANTTTTGAQGFSAMGMSANGDLVVVWAGEGSGDSEGIFAQRFDESVDDAGAFVTGVYVPNRAQPVAEGETLPAVVPSFTVAFSEDVSVSGGAAGANSVINKNNWQLRLNGANIAATAIQSITYGFNATTRRHEAAFVLANPLGTGNYQLEPGGAIQDLAGNAIDGNFDGTPGGAFIRSFVVTELSAIGPEFRVNATTTEAQRHPQVASDTAGNFVVVWDGSSPDGIFGQRFNASGTPVGPELHVNSFVRGPLGDSQVAMDPDGDFIVVWTSAEVPFGNLGIYGQRYTANGAPAGGEFLVTTTETALQQSSPSVAMDAAGNFVVVYEGQGNNDGDGVFAQRFDSNGVAHGAEFRINSVTAGDQTSPDIAMEPDGDFVVTWQSTGQDGSGEGVYCRRFTELGVAIDAIDLAVNTSTAGNQQRPAIAVTVDGSFAVAWKDDAGSDVIVRRFSEDGLAVTGEIVVDSTANSNVPPAIALDAGRNAIVTWEGTQTGADIFFARFDPFGNPVGVGARVNTTTAGNQQETAVAAQPNGGFIVAWGGASQDGTQIEIYAQRFGAAGAAAPIVQSVQVNDGTAQRSRVTSLTVTFSTQVTFASAVGNAFTLTRNGGGAVICTAIANVLGGVTVVTLNGFAGAETENASLRDGRYTLTVIANQISAGGTAMASNFTFADAQGLYRFYADVNGDRKVDISDFGFFSLAYLTSANYNPALDFNNDGRVDIADFGQFSLRYFTNLP